MTTSSPEDTLAQMHASLTGAFNSWHAKYGLSVAASHALLTQHIQQEEKAARLKHQKRACKPCDARKTKPGSMKAPSKTTMRPAFTPTPDPKFRSHDDERRAQEREDRICAAQEQPSPI